MHDFFQRRATDLGLLLVRLGFGGFLIACHGWEKITHFSEKSAVFPDPIGLGHLPSLLSSLCAEMGGGTLLILGLCTRLACVPLVFTMLVVATIVHQHDPWITSELAFLYAVAFAAVGIAGPGHFALDRLIAQARRLK